MTRREICVRVTRLREAGDDLNDYRHRSPAERLGMMSDLARDSWAVFHAANPHGAPTDAESRFPRRIVRVRRRGG